MATKKKTEETVETAATEVTETTEAATETTTATEKKFSLSNLAKNCRRLFGVSSCTFAGATAGLTGEYSVNEMKSIIETWCGKGIK